MHPEIAQCLRMLARLNYIMGDHVEAMACQQKVSYLYIYMFRTERKEMRLEQCWVSACFWASLILGILEVECRGPHVGEL